MSDSINQPTDLISKGFSKGFDGNLVISGTLLLIDRDARSSGPIKLRLDDNKKTMSFGQVVEALQSKLLNSGYQTY